MSSPSLVPNDRLDRDFYIVLEDFKSGDAFRETEEGMDYPTLITDLLSGQYDHVLRVVAFNPHEGWSRDAPEDIARDLERHASAHRWEMSEGLQDFIESHLGRKLGEHCRYRYRFKVPAASEHALDQRLLFLPRLPDDLHDTAKDPAAARIAFGHHSYGVNAI